MAITLLYLGCMGWAMFRGAVQTGLAGNCLNQSLSYPCTSLNSIWGGCSGKILGLKKKERERGLAMGKVGDGKVRGVSSLSYASTPSRLFLLGGSVNKKEKEKRKKNKKKKD